MTNTVDAITVGQLIDTLSQRYGWTPELMAQYVRGAVSNRGYRRGASSSRGHHYASDDRVIHPAHVEQITASARDYFSPKGI